MNLGTKIITGGIAAVVMSATVALLVQRHVIREQGIELIHDTMRTTLLEAENVRETVSQMNQQHAFDQQKLVAEYHKTGNLRDSMLYQTIPVVAAWKAVEQTAQKEGYEFRIPKRQARNEKNNPTPEEEKSWISLSTASSRIISRWTMPGMKLSMRAPSCCPPIVLPVTATPKTA